MRVLLTGATGFVGQALATELRTAGHTVLGVSRRPGADVTWAPESLGSGVERSDAVIHLAGESLIGRRWTARFKKELLASRIETTERLAALVARAPSKVLISASAVGYYGASDYARFVEGSAPGGGFLAELCRRWEGATAAAARAGARVAIVRIGVVLERDGGALARLVPLTRLGLGGRMGSGQQWVSWIHRADTVGLLRWILERDAARGVYNATAPEPVRQIELARALARALHRPAFVPAFEPFVRLVLGEAADTLLTGQHVTPARALAEGFAFRHAELAPALADIVARR